MGSQVGVDFNSEMTISDLDELATLSARLMTIIDDVSTLLVNELEAIGLNFYYLTIWMNTLFKLITLPLIPFEAVNDIVTYITSSVNSSMSVQNANIATTMTTTTTTTTTRTTTTTTTAATTTATTL